MLTGRVLFPGNQTGASAVIFCRFHGARGTASCNLGMTVPTGTILSFKKTCLLLAEAKK